jgi:hypothetical protein
LSVLVPKEQLLELHQQHRQLPSCHLLLRLLLLLVGSCCVPCQLPLLQKQLAGWQQHQQHQQRC